MFSGLIGYIKPLLGRRGSQVTQTPRVRPIDKDDAAGGQSYRDIQDRVMLSQDETASAPSYDSGVEHEDEMRISLSGIRHMVDQSVQDVEERRFLFEILDRLERKGVKTLPFDTTSSLIEQIKTYQD